MDWKNKINQIKTKFGILENGAVEEVSNACLVPDYKLEIVCTTHTGKVRGHNEDNFSVNQVYLPMEHQGLETPVVLQEEVGKFPAVAVFDGMGGEYGGEIASYVSAKLFAEYEHEGAWGQAAIVDLINKMNDAVCVTEQEAKARQMGSTFVGLFFNEETVWFANLGDSPSYLYRNGQLEQMSFAHTNERFLRMQGITNRKPGLTQFLGIHEEGLIIEPYVTARDMEADDVYLLCSDGLTDMVSEERICELIKENEDIMICAQKLQEEALENGGRDNITIMVCKVIK